MLKKVSPGALDRNRAQQRILKTFGVDAIDQAYHQFCTRCSFAQASSRLGAKAICGIDLFPLTTHGERCPYFTP